jgi:3D (Asp-Asp-Asp) domain-containing protein
MFYKLKFNYLKHLKNLLFVASLCLVVEAMFPQIVLAQTIMSYVNSDAVNMVDRFPVAEKRSARYFTHVPTTAYSSTPDQTDDTPFITASGTTVRAGVVAANFLPIGTRLRIPDYYGDTIFVVEDRMNERYDKRLDIWMETREQAIIWGLRYVAIEVL